MTAILQKLISKWVWKTSKCIRKEITKDIYACTAYRTFNLGLILFVLNKWCCLYLHPSPSIIHKRTYKTSNRTTLWIIFTAFPITYLTTTSFTIDPAFHEIDFFFKSPVESLPHHPFSVILIMLPQWPWFLLEQKTDKISFNKPNFSSVTMTARKNIPRITKRDIFSN